MQQSRKALRLSMLCSALLISACTEKRVVTALPIPAERIDCVVVGPRPTLPPEHVIDWPRLRSIAQAKSEHEHYVHSVRQREQIVAHYIVDVEAMQFACANDAAWLREWNAGTR